MAHSYDPHVSQQRKWLHTLNTRMMGLERKNISKLACIKATCLQNYLEWDLTWVWILMLTLAFGTINLSLVPPGLTVRSPGQSWGDLIQHSLFRHKVSLGTSAEGALLAFTAALLAHSSLPIKEKRVLDLGRPGFHSQSLTY